MVKNILRFLFSALAIISLFKTGFAITTLVTTEMTFADTIVAKIVSEIYKYPIVSVERDSVSEEVLKTLEELNTTDIIIIGGPYVVTPKVEEELRKYYNVTRIWGVTRYETSALVAEFFWDYSDEAVLVTRDVVNERISIRKIPFVRKAVDFAIEKGIPLLITPTGKLDENIIKALEILGVKKVYIFTLNPAIERTDLVRELKEMGINYTIVPPYEKVCEKPMKIAVPEDADWKFAKRFLEGFRCIEIVPVKTNISIEELNKEFDKVVLNAKSLKEIKRLVIEEMKRKMGKLKLEDVFLTKIDRILTEIDYEIKILEEYYNKTKNKDLLEVINKLEEYKEKILENVREGDYKGAMQLGIEALRYRNRWRWRYFWNRGIREELQEIEKVRRIVRGVHEKVLKEVYNITEKLEKRELMKKIREIVKGRTKAESEKPRFMRCPDRRPEICPQVHNPVCAKIETSAGVEWETFSNECIACSHKNVIGYIPGPCESVIEGRDIIKKRSPFGK